LLLASACATGGWGLGAGGWGLEKKHPRMGSQPELGANRIVLNATKQAPDMVCARPCLGPHCWWDCCIAVYI
jgi:hypothetical protein